MKLRFLFSLFFALAVFSLSAQSNVRGWYADGQVWIVWEASLPIAESYGIFARPTPFTSTTDAIPVGRPFYWEYLGGALKTQVDTSLTFRIPNGQGGLYQLAPNEGLFVFTPHQAGALWFAVVRPGETAVTPGTNLTQSAVPFQYDPVGDPVECHLQAVFPSPFSSNYTCLAYFMWADGRQAQWDNRPDFPVMANVAKNGMPSLFMVAIPPGLDTTQPFPMTIWLHGGGGEARQSLPGSRPIVNLKSQEGIVVAHNDDLIGWRGEVPPNQDQPSWHFGWRKNYNPFNSNNLPTEVDTIVNYTQRRYIWIDSWLMRHFNVDPARINLNGHSMGAAGSTALAKAFPDHYATVTLFNNGFGGPESGSNITVFGPVEENYPTNLTNRAGETAHLLDLWNLIDYCTDRRDWPLFRSFHSKNDDNGTMRWDAYVVENYRHADSTGIGAQLLWSERAHGIDEGPLYNDHWHNGNLPTQQTVIDDIAYEEAQYRSDISYPAFFNHRLDPTANDPGDGTLGVGPNGVGDDWGSWGGWHRWDWQEVAESEDSWSIVAWLESNAVFDNDNCPHNSLNADLAIRKPRLFVPQTGSMVNWRVEDATTGTLLQSGSATVQADDLVVVPQITVYQENTRKVRIVIAKASVGTDGVEMGLSRLRIEPNPSSGMAFLTVFSAHSGKARVVVSGVGGQPVAASETALETGQNRFSLSDFQHLPGGLYWISLTGDPGCRQVVKWVKI